MRTAVCISGQPRTVEKVHKEAVKYLFNNLGDYDLFIHSSESYPLDCDLWEEWNVISYQVEEQKRFFDLERRLKNVYFHPPILNNYLQQIYGWKRVWELKTNHEKENNVKYDFVIRTRPDILYHNHVTLDLFDLSK